MFAALKLPSEAYSINGVEYYGGIGFLKAIYDVVDHPVKIATDTVLIFVTGLLIASLALLADLIVRSRDS